MGLADTAKRTCKKNFVKKKIDLNGFARPNKTQKKRIAFLSSLTNWVYILSYVYIKADGTPLGVDTITVDDSSRGVDLHALVCARDSLYSRRMKNLLFASDLNELYTNRKVWF